MTGRTTTLVTGGAGGIGAALCAAVAAQGSAVAVADLGRGELIDHILVSHALVDLVADGAVTTDTTQPDPSITDDPGTRRDAAGSDHRPGLAAIDL